MKSLKTQFEDDGYFSPLRLIDTKKASYYRNKLETIEKNTGPLHYKFKIHTVLAMAYELATDRALLDCIEELLGPNILLYNATFIIKEPHSDSHVSWHQDLAYWGFNDDNQVSAWIALSAARKENGCMRMLPGSHKVGQQQHITTTDSSNVLHHGQTVEGVCEERSRLIPLEAGEVSLHHGWTLHTSPPNISDERRIGLNINYISTDMFQTQTEDDSAILVRGIDDYNHFKLDTPSVVEFDESAWNKQNLYDQLIRKTYDDMDLD